MKHFQSYSLQPYNTFGFDVSAREAAVIESVRDVQELARSGQLQSDDVLILGGGSNVLLRNNLPGLTVLNRIPGVEVQAENQNEVHVKVGAGENWHNFVEWAVNRGLGGVENLSLIPGSTGAAPMQNIGAYGIELESVFQKLEAVHRKTGKVHTFNKDECGFGYRTSIFKTSVRNEFVITSVVLKLSRNPRINTSYGAIESELEKRKVKNPTVKDVSEAVISIRRSKLPDPKETGNSGSFFKNPVVDFEEYERIKKEHPEVVAYEVPAGMKLAAGWMIDRAGWKGKRFNGYGVHDKQALVLVNYGTATGDEVYRLSEEIIEDIEKKFGVVLEREVNVIPEKAE